MDRPVSFDRWRVHDSSTSSNLIESLALADRSPDAWSAFVEKYTPLIRRWCARWGASEDQTEEVLQETLLLVFRKFRQYRPVRGFGFRSWLKTIAYRTRLKLIQAQKRSEAESFGDRLTPEVLKLLSSEEATRDLCEALDELCDTELLDLAARHVEASVETRTWESFRLMQFEELTGNEVSIRLGMSRLAVYKAVSKVRRLIREEFARIESDGP